MKKGFKLLFLGTTTVCLSLSMLPSAYLYTSKAENIQTECVYRNSMAIINEALALKQQNIQEEAADRQEEARLTEKTKKKEEVRKEAKETGIVKKIGEKKSEEIKNKAEETKKKVDEVKKKVKAEKNAYNIEMTAEDKENLYRIVQSEVGYMDEKSKLFVASVVLNRVEHSSFPNTVTGVVMAHNPRTGVYQFSPVKPGGRFWKCEATKETRQAVDKVLKNGDYSNGAIAFVAKKYTTYKAASWFDNNLHHLFRHNGQDYYRYR